MKRTAPVCERPAARRTVRPGRPARLSALAGVAWVVAACSGGSGRMTGDAANEALADTLRARIADAYDFGRVDVVERMLALYADTARVISASNGQLTSSPDSLRAGIAAFWENVGRNMRSPRWEWEEVHVERLSHDAAVLTGTWAIPHTAPTGRPHTIRGAWTAVFRRIGGEWRIVHEHLSAPPGDG